MYTTVAQHKKYEFRKDAEKKSLIAIVRGYYEKQDVLDFAADYEKIVKAINPSEYELIIECKDMETSDEKLLDELSGVFVMYEKTGFTPIKVVESESKIAFLQLKGAIRKSGVKVQYIKTLAG